MRCCSKYMNTQQHTGSNASKPCHRVVEACATWQWLQLHHCIKPYQCSHKNTLSSPLAPAAPAHLANLLSLAALS